MKLTIKSRVGRYTLYGVLFGLLFPVSATLIECWLHIGQLTTSNIVHTQVTHPVMWLVDTAPFVLGLFGYLIGVKESRVEHYADTLEEMVEAKTAELANTGNYLENIIDSMADIMLIMDNEGILKKINSAVLSIFGFEKTELVGRSAAAILGEQDLNKILLKSANDLFESGFLRTIDGVYPSKNGYNVYLSTSVSYIWDKSGEQQGIVCVCKDVTDRQKMETALRQSEEQYRDLVQSLNVIILKADSQFNFTFLNKFGQAFFGYSEEEVIGKSVVGTIVPNLESTGRDLGEMIDRIIAHPDDHLENENENVCKDGKRVWVAWRNQPIFDEQGELLEIMCTGYDVTDRLEAEKKIKQQQLKLETANQQMTSELEQARLAQLALLRTELPDLPNVKLAAKYSPMAQIGGDFYDLYCDRGEKLGILVGDVTGHGVPAALLSFLFLTTFKNNRIDAKSPAAVMQLSNTFLAGKLPTSKYASMFYCVYDLKKQILSYTCAGHPPGFLIRPGSDQLVQLKTEGMVVGMFDDPIISFESKSIELISGDKVLIYTDGIIEVTNMDNKQLDAGKLEAFLLSHRQKPIDQLLDLIFEFSFDYSDSQGFDDDVTMIGLEVF